MRKWICAAGALALSSGVAFAADDIMANFYGNTVVSTGGMAEVHTHYKADHTFDLTGSMMGMSRSYKGTWQLDGKGNICRTFVGDLPPNATNPNCSPMTSHKVGETWTATAPNGSTRTITLKAGIQ